MLKKLTKYDFHWSFRVVVWFMLAAAVCAVFARITGSLYNGAENATMALLVLDKLASALLFAACAALYLIAFLRTAARFVTALYKDESYLTHTLPVRRGTVFDAKAVSGAAMLLLSLVVIALALLVGAGGSVVTQLKEYVAKDALTAVLMTALFAAELLCMLFAVYLGCVLGYRFNTKKGLYAVLFSLAVYFGVQTVLSTVLFGSSFLDADIGDFFRKALLAADPSAIGTAVTKLSAISLGLYVAADAVLWILGRKALEKGVNVD